MQPEYFWRTKRVDKVYIIFNIQILNIFFPVI